MARKRPTAVLVMGILNIVFGSLGLICLICGGLVILVLFAGGAAAQENRDVYTFVDKEVPGYIAVTIANLVLRTVLTIILLISGIGLLSMQSWARWGSVTYGVIVILLSIASPVYQLAVLNPALDEWEREAGGPRHQALRSAPTIGGACISMVYAIALLVVMFLPSVSAAFAGRTTRRSPDEDDYGGYEGRRREDDWDR